MKTILLTFTLGVISGAISLSLIALAALGYRYRAIAKETDTRRACR